MQHDERYRKQILVPEFGPAGQAALSGSSIAIVGCGALGSAQAMLLARAGAGHLILIDRDIVEESNLHRQILYTEADATACRPKAAAAAGHLAAVNSRIRITAAFGSLIHKQQAHRLLLYPDNLQRSFRNGELDIRMVQLEPAKYSVLVQQLMV